MTNVVPLRRAAEIGCSACGVTVDAGCDCGAPYLPAGQRVAEFDAANPGKSTRQVGAALGLHHSTVHEVRKRAGVGYPTTERVTGPDGKSYPARRPQRDEEDLSHLEDATPAELRNSFLVFSNEAMLLARYEGPIDDVVLRAAKATAAAWCRLVEIMEQGS
jgi:hypothetical protein